MYISLVISERSETTLAPIDLFKNGLCSTFYIVNACAQAAFLVGDVMLLTMAFKKVKRNGGKPAVQNLVYVCNINFMFMLCLCLVYEATSCVKKQKSFGACEYDVRIVHYDWSNNRSQALFKTIDHRSRLPNNSLLSFRVFSSSVSIRRAVAFTTDVDDGRRVKEDFVCRAIRQILHLHTK